MSPIGSPKLAEDIPKVIVSSFLPSGEDIQLPLDLNPRASSDNPNVVSRLLTENPWEKAALAEIYDRDVIRASEKDTTSRWGPIWKQARNRSQKEPQVFIESGSTCAYVSELLRRLVLGEHQRVNAFKIGTNNHLTAWLFLNRHLFLDSRPQGDTHSFVPYLFAGRLESKYHGIFPFYRESSRDTAPEERRGYAQLRLSLARFDMLLLAASRLSLKYGPLVGSRENAIFKNACYNSCVPPIGRHMRKEIHLFITIQKLVAHAPANSARVKDETSFREFHTWHEEHIKIKGRQCFPTFDVPTDPSTTGTGNVPDQSPFSTDLIQPESAQSLVDGTIAVEMGHGRFRVCRTWHELFTKANLTVRVYVSFKGIEDVQHDPNYRWIKAEVDEARAYLAGKNVGITLQRVGTKQPVGSHDKFSVVRIDIGPADQP